MKPVLLLAALLSICPIAPGDYLRVVEGEDGVEDLQVAVREFRLEKPAAARLRLVAVSHIGGAGYFAEIQEILDDADLVLYEGVDGEREEFRNMVKGDEHGHATLQVGMAEALGLAFQLHEIDYGRDHFINSDLSGVELLAVFQGEDVENLDEAGRKKLEAMLATMERESPGGRVTAALLARLEDHPEWSRAMRWGLVRIMGNLRGDMSRYAGLPDDMRQLMEVLIRKRNDAVMEDIRERLGTLPEDGTLAVFYGAAHMPDFEERLTREFQAETADTRWITAFSGNLDRSGLNSFQKAMVAWMVNQQVRTIGLMTVQGETGPVSVDPGGAPPEKN